MLAYSVETYILTKAEGTIQSPNILFTLHRFKKPPCLLKRHITAPSKREDDQSQNSDRLSPLDMVWSRAENELPEVNWRCKEQWNLKEERAYHGAPASFNRQHRSTHQQRCSKISIQHRFMSGNFECTPTAMGWRVRWFGVCDRSREGSDGVMSILERSEEAWRDGALRKAEGEVLRAACPPSESSQNAGGRNTGRWYVERPGRWEEIISGL
jgi:hypothetical protein